MHLLKTYIVEDSQLIRESLTATLEELGSVKVVGVAADQSTAIAWLNKPGGRVDLVIVDIFLQGGSGLGVLRAIAEQVAPPAVVVLSNFATVDMRRSCMDLGAVQVFDKSHDIEALLAYCNALQTQNLGTADLLDLTHCH